jgi:uncharacterized protein (DUF1778 family)
MDLTINWKPEQNLLQKLIDLADQTGQSPEIIINEAVKQYLENQTEKQRTEELVLPESDLNILVSALDNPPKANPVLKAGDKQQSQSFNKWSVFLPKRIDALEFQQEIRREWDE